MKVSVRAPSGIFRKEVKGFFITPIAYVFIVVYVSLLGLLTYVQGCFFEIGEASLTYTFFKWHPWLNAFLVPAIGMRVWTEESKQNTLELLLTHPVTLPLLILFKYLAALVPLLTALLLTAANVITVEYLGSPDYGPVLTAYLGSFLMAAAFLAVACCCSSLTRSSVVSFIISCSICFLFLIIGSRQMGNGLVDIFPQSKWLVDGIASIGLLQYFDTFQRGILDFTSIACFVAIIFFALTANYYILARREGFGKRNIFGRFPSIVILLLMLFGIGIVSLLFKQVGLRVDLTANKMYSLSEGSKKILSALERDVTIRFYVNESANILSPRMRNYSRRVADFISLLEHESKGKVKFERYDPVPDSDAAVSAEMDNIHGTLLPSGVEGYMGLAFVCLDQKSAIPFLDLSREPSLEYDIIRKIRDVSKLSGRKTIGVYGTVPIFGVPDMFPQWQLLDELNSYYNIIQLFGNEAVIDPDIDVVLIVHPLGLNSVFEKALDRYLQGGGDMMVMFDPVALSFMFYRQSLVEQNASSSWPRLEAAVNLHFSHTNAVLDMTLRSEMDRGEGLEELNFILSLSAQQMNAKHQISDRINQLILPTTGCFHGTPPRGIKKTVLMQSTADSALQHVRSLLNVSRIEAETMNRTFSPDPEQYDLAVLLEGRFPSLMTGKVESEAQPARIIVWGDSDFVSDPFTGETVTIQGREVFYPKNSNLTLVQNAIDYLCDSAELNAARSKTRNARPLTRLIELERSAEKKYISRIQELDVLSAALNKELEHSRLITSARLDGTIRDKATRQRIQTLEKKMRIAKNELRILRKDLRLEIQGIRNRVIIFNAILIPLFWSFVGAGILMRRHCKTRPRALSRE
ncbi:hypothetical protein EGM51_01415 [Verrucomicrobia bacterium S94]|nr:hypothetical protein EGM51_01415 [Verrucomicrobia bacterium S94]